MHVSDMSLMQAVKAQTIHMLEQALLGQGFRCCDACCKAKHTSQFDHSSQGFDAVCKTCKAVVSRCKSLGISLHQIRAAIHAGGIHAADAQNRRKKVQLGF
jgi:hypothetical protein